MAHKTIHLYVFLQFYSRMALAASFSNIARENMLPQMMRQKHNMMMYYAHRKA